jgi:hypothetical protein
MNDKGFTPDHIEQEYLLSCDRLHLNFIVTKGFDDAIIKDLPKCLSILSLQCFRQAIWNLPISVWLCQELDMSKRGYAAVNEMRKIKIEIYQASK